MQVSRATTGTFQSSDQDCGSGLSEARVPTCSLNHCCLRHNCVPCLHPALILVLWRYEQRLLAKCVSRYARLISVALDE